MGLNNLCFNRPSRWFWSTLTFSPLLILYMILGKSSFSLLGLNFFTSKLEDCARFYIRVFLTLTFWFYKIEHCLDRPTTWQRHYYNLFNTHHSKAHIAEEVSKASFSRSHCPQWKYGYLYLLLDMEKLKMRMALNPITSASPSIWLQLVD